MEKQGFKKKNYKTTTANLLIVDDEETIRFACTLILSDAGYRVFTAKNQFDAMEILGSHKIDVAIVDRFLESDNGMDLVEHINKTQKACTSILISAYPLFQIVSEKDRQKFFAYLQKPIKIEDLCATVARAITEKLKI